MVVCSGQDHHLLAWAGHAMSRKISNYTMSATPWDSHLAQATQTTNFSFVFETQTSYIIRTTLYRDFIL